MQKKREYRIISIEACDIYRSEKEYGAETGYKLPEYKSEPYFRQFKAVLDYSLDSIELEIAYTRICRRKFSFADKHNNLYTLAVVNLKFNYTYKETDGKIVNKKTLRKHFYENGFNLDGDIASWEAYRALSLSSIKGMIEIPLDGMLFVPDYKSTFTDEVVSVGMKDDKLIAKQKETEITNDIWDGESLLDESLFAGDYVGRHFLLLRNKLFKSCAFKTKLKKWIKDKGITLADLKARGFV